MGQCCPFFDLALILLLVVVGLVILLLLLIVVVIVFVLWGMQRCLLRVLSLSFRFLSMSLLSMPSYPACIACLPNTQGGKKEEEEEKKKEKATRL